MAVTDTNLVAQLQSKLDAVTSATSNSDMVLLAAAMRGMAVDRTIFDAELQARITALDGSETDTDLLMLAKSIEVPVATGGVPIGTIVEGLKDLELSNPSLLPQGSFVTESSQPLLWPKLEAQPLWATGSYTDIAVEDVPSGTFGVSTDSNDCSVFSYQVDLSVQEPPVFVVFRTGYNSASTVVKSVSTDGGITWTHSAVTDYDGGTSVSKIPNEISPSNSSSHYNFAGGTSSDTNSVRIGSTVWQLHNNYTSPIRAASLDTASGVLGVTTLGGVIETDPNALTEVNGQFLLVTRDSTKHLCLYTHSNANMVDDWVKVYTTPEADHLGFSVNGSYPSSFYYDESTSTYYWASPRDLGSNNDIIVRRSTDLINWTTIGNTPEVTNSLNYFYVKIVKFADTLALVYGYSNDTRVRAFTDTEVSGSHASVNTTTIPRITYWDKETNTLNYSSDATDPFEYTLDLNGGIDELGENRRPKGSALVNNFSPTWVDKHQSHSYVTIISYDSSSGGSNMVIRHTQPPTEIVKSVPTFGVSHTNATAYIQGE